jgi:hypothetical protein
VLRVSHLCACVRACVHTNRAALRAAGEPGVSIVCAVHLD